MLLIFEGIDTSGKDTIMNEVNKHLNFEIVRGSSFELTNGKDEMELFYSFYRMTALDNVILNRYVYSNLVYAPIFSDYNMMNVEELPIIENKLKDKAVIIYLHADKDVITDRFKSRGEKYVDENQIEEILESYRDILQNTELDVISINTGKSSIQESVDSILSFLDIV